MRNKSCGDCTLCCTVLGIKDENFEKPKYEKCPHECGSCAIYDTRPTSCRTFECIWLTSQELPKHMPRMFRPDQCHVVLGPSPLGKFYNAWVDPRYPNAWRYGEFGKFLLRLSCSVDVALTDGTKFFRIKDGVVGEMEIIHVDENGYQQLRLKAPNGDIFGYDAKAPATSVVVE